MATNDIAVTYVKSIILQMYPTHSNVI